MCCRSAAEQRCMRSDHLLSRRRFIVSGTAETVSPPSGAVRAGMQQTDCAEMPPSNVTKQGV